MTENKKLESIERKLDSLLEKATYKSILNFKETVSYMNVSNSFLYKMTSLKKIPHYCPEGKLLYFNRHEIDQWLLRNRQLTIEEIEAIAVDTITTLSKGGDYAK